LYMVTDSVDEAVNEVQRFYRVYHSMRYVSGYLVLRLQKKLSDVALAGIRASFADILSSGTFEQTTALRQEANEPALAAMPRLKFRFDRHSNGRLRELINFVNGEDH